MQAIKICIYLQGSQFLGYFNPIFVHSVINNSLFNTELVNFKTLPNI